MTTYYFRGTDDLSKPSRYAIAVLLALPRMGKHVYSGTVPGHVKAKRRAANRVARTSRRLNRGK